MIESNLINKLNTIYKGVVSRESIYIKEDSSCSLDSLLSMSSFVRFVRCRTCRTRPLACRAMLVCQVVEHANNRAICYRLLYKVYTSYNELGS